MGRIHFIPDRDRIEESVAHAERYNACFEYNDFMEPNVYLDKEKAREIIDFYKQIDRDRTNDTLHGAFYDVTVHSTDEDIRKISKTRIYQSLDIARELGVKGVIFHTNFIPNFRLDYYRECWLKRNVDFYTKACMEYKDLEIYVENMFDEDYDMLLMLAKQMKEIPNFGVCLDYAHAASFGENPVKWLEELMPYIKHMHINDNDLRDDLHLAIGNGQIDWSEFFSTVKRLNYDSSMLIEVKELENQETSIRYLKDNNLI